MLYFGNVLALCHKAVIKQYCMCTMLQTRPNQTMINSLIIVKHVVIVVHGQSVTRL